MRKVRVHYGKVGWFSTKKETTDIHFNEIAILKNFILSILDSGLSVFEFEFEGSSHTYSNWNSMLKTISK